MATPDQPGAREKLDAYRTKRDFSRTAEPAGGDVEASDSGRLYVIQKHDARNLHYDLRLEFDGVLKSWAVPKGPSLDPKQKPLAVLVEDHPIEYGSFEGIIPRGEYGGGTVLLWDRGEWEPIGDPVEGLEKGDLKFRLHGEKLRGDWVLARMSGAQNEDGRNWLLIKKRDDESRSIASFNILAELPWSVASGRGLDEIAADPEAVWKDGKAVALGEHDGAAPARPAARRRGAPDPTALTGAVPGAPPETLKPQLATLVEAAPEGDHWIHEIKLDGYRLVARITGGDVQLLTRNGHDWTDRFEPIARALGRLPVDDAVLDGEVVVLGRDGISSFQALQNALRGYNRARMVYYLFDVPFAAGVDLRKTPLLERKQFLHDLIRAAPLAAPTVQYCDHIVGKGPTVLEQAAASGLEGIVSKRADAPYESRRTATWLKAKCTHQESFVVCGYTQPKKGLAPFGALVLGQHNRAGGMVYCGRVGTGFDDRTLESLGAMLAERAQDDSPFATAPGDVDPGKVTWVEPVLVVDVEFTEWTDEGYLRHPTYRGLRDDLEPGDVHRADTTGDVRATAVVKAPQSPADATVAGVRISNPNRTVYPEDGVTKRDVAEYYAAVAEWILPHVVRRPLSLVRCPLGLAGEAFYQRHVGDGFPDAIRGIEVEGEDEPCIVIDDVTGLISLAQMGVLEIHPWGCRADNLERPDTLVIDLDPGPGIEWPDLVGSAQFIGTYLRDLGLESFVKTSGGKGIHLLVPIVRRSDWAEAKAFTAAIAARLVGIAPRNFVATMAKTHREQRIFIDYLRNQRGSTSVGAYSTRARNGACVSTPLSWDELSGDIGPDRFTVRTVPERLATIDADPWDGYGEIRQSITASMRRAVAAP